MKIKIIIPLLIFFIAVGALLGYVLLISDSSTSETQVFEDGNRPVNSVDYGPPTNQETDSGNTQKNKTVDTNTEVLKPEEAQVAIVDASQYNSEVEVRAFVSNVLQDGTCRFEFSMGSESFEKEISAKADATTTLCLSLVIPRSEFQAPGDWQVVVSYTSNDGAFFGSTSSILEVQ